MTEFAVSPDGHWLAFERALPRLRDAVAAAGQAGRRSARRSTRCPVRQLDVDAGEYLHWSGDSQRLHFGRSATELFTRELQERVRLRCRARPRSCPRPPAKGVRHRLQPSRRRARRRTIAIDRRAHRHDEGRRGHRRRHASSSTATASPPSGRAAEVAVPAGANAHRRHGKTIIPGLVDVHWHGAMGDDGIIPQQSWINYAGARVRRDDAARSVQRHRHDLQRTRRCSAPAWSPARASSRPARSCTAPRRRSPRPIDSLDDALDAPAAPEGAGRDQRQELQPAAPRAAPADPRGRAPDRHDGGARGRLAVRAQHDDGGRRPHRRRALDPGRATPTTTCKQLWSQTQGRLHADADRRLRRPRRRALLVRHDRRLEAPDPARLRAPQRARRARPSPRAPRRTRSTTHFNESPSTATELSRAGVRVQHRRARPARGPGRALGDVDARAGRHDAAGGAAHAPRSTARTTSAWTRTSARWRPASWPTWW